MNKVSLKKMLFIVMVGIVMLPAVASAKPPRDRHTPTPAMKSHLAKLPFGR